MHSFEPDELPLRVVGKRRYKLTADVVYRHTEAGFKPVTIPAGFVTDLASFPHPAIVLCVAVLAWMCPTLVYFLSISMVLPWAILFAGVVTVLAVRFLIVFDPTARKWRSALAHDWFYKHKMGNRFIADARFRIGCIHDGVSVVDAWFAWVAVRLFGGRHWKRQDIEEP